MYLKLGFHLFTKKLLFNVMTILQLCVTLILMNLLIGKVNYQAINLHAMKNFPAQSVYFNMAASSIGDTEARLNKVQELIGEHQGELTAEQVTRSYGTAGDALYTLVGYGEKTLQYWELPVKGKKPAAVKNGDRIPCLAYEGVHKIGEILPLQLLDNQEVSLTFEIVGLLGRDTKLLDISVSSNDAQFDMFFGEPDPGLDYLIFNQACVPALQRYNARLNSIVYFEDIRMDRIDEIVDEFNRYTWMPSIHAMRDTSLETVWTYVESFLPLFICLFMVGFLSTFSLTIMNAVKNMRTFSIFYICGMHWMDSVGICLGYIACLVLGVGICLLPVLSGAYAGDFLSGNGLVLNEYNLLLSAALIALVVLFSILPPLFLMKREKPLMTLRNGW